MNYGNKFTMKNTQYKVVLILAVLILGAKSLDAAALDEVFRSFHTVMGVTNISMRGVYETTARKCGPVERMLFVGR